MKETVTKGRERETKKQRIRKQAETIEYHHHQIAQEAKALQSKQGCEPRS